MPVRLLGFLGSLALYGLGAPAFHRLRRARRAQRALNPAERIEVAWADASEALETGLGLSRPTSATRGEWATRLASEMRVPSELILQLGSAITKARYAPAQLDEHEALTAETAASQVRNLVRGRQTWWKRWLSDLDPRRLIKPTKRRLAPAPA